MTRIAIILGSTRTGRKSEAVGDWVFAAASQRDDAEFEIVDLRDFDLPFFDEEISPAWQPSSDPRVQAWSDKIAGFDGFVFVTPEYNHSTSTPSGTTRPLPSSGTAGPAEPARSSTFA
jgi:NAD(P)H-dependent FMN reductase